MNDRARASLYGLFAAPVIVLAAATLPALLGPASRAAAAARYPFPVVEAGDSSAEIAFLEARIAAAPDRGLDRAQLAAAFLREARRTGSAAHWTRAEAEARRSLAALPMNNAGALAVLAHAAAARHDFDAAVAFADRALAMRADHQGALTVRITASLATGDLDAAEDDAVALVRRLPSLHALTLAALVAEARGDDALAVARLGAAFDYEETGEVATSAWARTLAGRLHLRQGRLVLARAYLEEARRLRSDDPEPLAHLATIEELEGRVESARCTLRRASRIGHDHSGITTRLAVLARDAGELDRAARLFTESEHHLRHDLATSPLGHRAALVELLLARAEGFDIVEAATIARAEATDRPNATSHHLLARALLAAGRPNEAQAALDRALATGYRDRDLTATEQMIRGSRQRTEAFPLCPFAAAERNRG